VRPGKPCSARDSESPKECLCNLKPLFLKRIPGWVLSRSLVPIRGIGRISFLSVKIRVYPGARLIFVLLRGFVSPRPVAFGIPPQSSKRIAQPCGRFISKQGLAELLQVHEARLPSANFRRQPDIPDADSNPSRDEKFLLILFLDYWFLN
jgi:hypothetical protein